MTPAGSDYSKLWDRVNGVEGKVDLLRQRVEDHEDWVQESRKFHVEIRTFRDTLIARQVEEEKTQKQRHESNRFLLHILLVVASYIGITLTILGILFGKAAMQQGLLHKMHIVGITAPENAKRATPLTSIPAIIAARFH